MLSSGLAMGYILFGLDKKLVETSYNQSQLEWEHLTAHSHLYTK